MENRNLEDFEPVKSDVLTLEELDSVLHSVNIYSDYSIGCYSLRSKDAIESIFANGISLKNNKNVPFKDKVKYMGLVRNVPISKVEGYCYNVITSEDTKTCTEINVIVLFPPCIHNYYSKSTDGNDYFLGYYPVDVEDFNYINDVDLINLLENRIGKIPKEFVLGYIEKTSNLVNDKDVKIRFVTNPNYYSNLSNHNKAAADYEFIKNISISKLMNICMDRNQFIEIQDLIKKSNNNFLDDDFQDEYVNWKEVERLAQASNSGLQIDKKTIDSYNKQSVMLRELKNLPQLTLKEKQYLEYFNPNSKILTKSSQKDIYKNLEGMTVEDYRRNH